MKSVEVRLLVGQPDLVITTRRGIEVLGPLLSFVRQEVPADSTARRFSQENALTRLSSNTSATFFTQNQSCLHTFRRTPAEPTSFLEWSWHRDDYTQMARPLDTCFRAMLEAAADLGATQGMMTRHAVDVSALPNPPLARLETHAILVSAADVAASYDDPAVFWSAWDVQEKVGDLFLLGRRLDKTDDMEMHRSIEEDQWRLWKAAKPNKTTIGHARIPAALEKELRARPKVLDIVGYDAPSRTLELACAASPGVSLLSLEVVDVFRILEAHEMSDGRAVDTVKVTFAHESVAREWKRVFLDIGCQVWFLDGSGDLVRLAA